MNELIEKARNGDKDAFLEVYSSNRKNLYKYCRNLCGNDADAQDLMQQTYLRAWLKIPGMKSENISSWLRSVARSIFLNNLKKINEYYIEEYPEIPDNSQNPEFITEKRDMCRILLKALKDCLSPVQRMTIILYYYDEKSVSEIANIMQVSENTVKSRLFNARKKLREELKKFGNIFYLSVSRLCGHETQIKKHTDTRKCKDNCLRRSDRCFYGSNFCELFSP